MNRKVILQLLHFPKLIIAAVQGKELTAFSMDKAK